MVKKNILILSILLMAGVVSAQTSYLTWTTNAGVITITGYIDSPTDVNIPSSINGFPVTKITDIAFSGCSSITSINIPNSVTNLGRYPLYNIFNLNTISVDDLNNYYSSTNGVLFDKNKTVLIKSPQARAGNYTIPNSVTSIGVSAFHSCTNLTSITIPNSVTNIGDLAFAYTGLTSFTIPNSVTSIGIQAFQQCTALTNVIIGSSVTNIGSSAFYYCTGLTGITIPNSVTLLGAQAFIGCSSLTDVSIGNSVSNINRGTFRSCTALTNVVLGARVGLIKQRAFRNCPELRQVKFKGAPPTLRDVDILKWGPYGDIFLYDDFVTVYRLPYVAGWPDVPNTWAGTNTALWTFLPSFYGTNNYLEINGVPAKDIDGIIQ